MAGIAPSGAAGPRPATKKRERRAAGIYGAIVTAAILAAVGERLPTAALVVSVVVTLLVYWVAEEYAEILGEQAEGGTLPTWAYIRGALAATWPMVSASYAPLLALLLARLAAPQLWLPPTSGWWPRPCCWSSMAGRLAARHSCADGSSSWPRRWPPDWDW